MKHMENFYNEGFDIEDYVKGDWSESDYKSHNDIDQIYLENQDRKVSLEDIMNGNVGITSLGGNE